MLLPGQSISIVLPKLKQKASDKIHGRSEEHVFLAYFERHGVCDGSILTVPLKALLTGQGSFALQRSRDFRTIGEPTFPLARAREWNEVVRSAKLWTNATQEQLDNEIAELR